MQSQRWISPSQFNISHILLIAIVGSRSLLVMFWVHLVVIASFYSCFYDSTFNWYYLRSCSGGCGRSAWWWLERIYKVYSVFIFILHLFYIFLLCMIIFPISLYWYDQPKLTLSTRWCSEQWFLLCHPPSITRSLSSRPSRQGLTRTVTCSWIVCA